MRTSWLVLRGKVFEIARLSQSTSIWLGIWVTSLLSVGSLLNSPVAEGSRLADYVSSVVLAGARGLVWFIALGTLISLISPLKTRLRASLVAFLYASTEVLRTVSIGMIGVSERLFPDLTLDHRIISGSITGLTLFSLGAMLHNSSREYRLQLKQLVIARSETLATINRLDAELTRRRKTVLDDIRASVEGTLRAVIRDLKIQGTEVDSHVAAQALIDLSNQAIRPLSHSLKSDTPQLPTFAEKFSTPKIELRKLLSSSTTVEPFRPEVVLVLAVMLLAGSLLVGGKERDLALWILAVLILFVLALWLSRRFLLPLIRQLRSVTLRAVIISVIYLGAAAGSFLGINFTAAVLSLEESSPAKEVFSASLVIYTCILALIVNWLLAFYTAQNRMRLETLELLKDQALNLQWQRARAISRIWLDQQNLSQSIHGEVQGQLIAEAMRLQRSVEKGVPLKTVLGEVENSLRDTLARLGDKQVLASIERHTKDLKDIWAGNVEVALNASQNVLQKLSLDVQCVALVCSFMDEFIVNAVKHGGANAVTFTLSFPEPRLLRVMASNNGSPLPARIENGLGLSMLQGQAVSMTWSASTEVGAWICLEFAYKAEESESISG